MELINAFANGNVAGIEPISEVIDTQLSKVFIGRTKAYKVYKKKVAFFKHLEKPEFRKKFYNEDFSWNQWMSPYIYLSLRPVTFRNNEFITVEENEAEDYFIEMALVDTTSTLSPFLIDKKLTSKHIKKVADVLSQKIDTLTKEKWNEISQIHSSWDHLYSLRLDDIEEYATHQSTIPKSITDRALIALRKQHKESNFFKNYPKNKLSVGIDGHSDNIILLEDDMHFIDIFLFEERWRLIDPHFDICRLIVDLEALGQPELVPIFCDSSKNNPNNLPKDIQTSYELTSAIIKGAYNAIIGRDELAKLYIPLIEKRTAFLE